uniref:Ubiquitin-like domain-containing protein n=1 Tax=Fagus sylvatica TaxID=28930 RepID=A0A2N9J2N5_FAGSY
MKNRTIIKRQKLDNAGATSGEANDPKGQNRDIKITVKFLARSIPVTLSQDLMIRDLKSLLQPLTDLHPRSQKLICKGRVLLDTMTLRASEVPNGAKVLLIIASQGLMKPQVPVTKTMLEHWKASGVVALSEGNYETIPGMVWACGPSARVLVLMNNNIREVPAQLGFLSSLQKLFLNANALFDESISWEALVSLKNLKVLSLDQNYLTTLPSALGTVTSLRELHVANNRLTSLPIEIGLLTQLQVLGVNNNRISIIPACVGDCNSLIEVNLSSNLLSELPETFGNLRDLKVLHISNNGLKSLPSTLFKMCLQLSTLDLDNTEITMDLLRQFEGWESFDERRRLKHSKQLDFRILSSAKVDEGDEGADKN